MVRHPGPEGNKPGELPAMRPGAPGAPSFGCFLELRLDDGGSSRSRWNTMEMHPQAWGFNQQLGASSIDACEQCVGLPGFVPKWMGSSRMFWASQNSHSARMNISNIVKYHSKKRIKTRVFSAKKSKFPLKSIQRSPKAEALGTWNNQLGASRLAPQRITAGAHGTSGTTEWRAGWGFGGVSWFESIKKDPMDL